MSDAKDNDKLRFFAVWTKKIAYALDVYPEEIESHRRDLINQRQHVAGPFDTQAEAEAVALQNLTKLSNG